MVHFCVHLTLLLVTIISQVKWFTTSHFCFVKNHFNIIFPCMPWLSKLSPFLRLIHQTLYAFLFCLLCATFPVHFIPLVFFFLIVIVFGEVTISHEVFILQFSEASFTFSLLDPNNFLCIVFLNTHCTCSSLNERDLVMHPRKAKGKTVV